MKWDAWIHALQVAQGHPAFQRTKSCWNWPRNDRVITKWSLPVIRNILLLIWQRTERTSNFELAKSHENKQTHNILKDKDCICAELILCGFNPYRLSKTFKTFKNLWESSHYMYQVIPIVFVHGQNGGLTPHLTPPPKFIF